MHTVKSRITAEVVAISALTTGNHFLHSVPGTMPKAVQRALRHYCIVTSSDVFAQRNDISLFLHNHVVDLLCNGVGIITIAGRINALQIDSVVLMCH